MENSEVILSDDILTEDINKEKNTKLRSRKSKDEFKEKECEIINYNKYTKTLDIRFNDYGIRLKDVNAFLNNNGIVTVKYKGEIGKPNFTVKV